MGVLWLFLAKMHLWNHNMKFNTLFNTLLYKSNKLNITCMIYLFTFGQSQASGFGYYLYAKLNETKLLSVASQLLDRCKCGSNFPTFSRKAKKKSTSQKMLNYSLFFIL